MGEKQIILLGNKICVLSGESRRLLFREFRGNFPRLRCEAWIVSRGIVSGGIPLTFAGETINLFFSSSVHLGYVA